MKPHLRICACAVFLSLLFLYTLPNTAFSAQNKDSLSSSDIIQATPELANKIIKDTTVTILDVRTAAEYKTSHIHNAILIPVQELQQRISEIKHLKDNTILVYCRTGNRSKKALQILQQNGFTKLIHLEKGINSWISEGYKVE